MFFWYIGTNTHACDYHFLIMLPLNSFREFPSFWYAENERQQKFSIFVISLCMYIQQYAYLCLIITPSDNLIFDVTFRPSFFGQHSTRILFDHYIPLGCLKTYQKLIIFAHILCIWSGFFAYSISSFWSCTVHWKGTRRKETTTNSK